LSYSDKLNDVQRIMLEKDPIGFLKYVAEQVTTASDIAGIGVDTFPVGLVNLSTRFIKENVNITNLSDIEEKVKEITIPISDNVEQVIQNINDAFEEKVLTPVGSAYRITLSQPLINEALRITLRANPDMGNTNPFIYGETYNEEVLRKEAGISDTDTPLDFVRKYSSNKAQIESFLKNNPSVKIQFDDGNSQFDPQTNTVNISLPELYEGSIRTGIPFGQMIDIMIQHELAHAAFLSLIRKRINQCGKR